MRLLTGVANGLVWVKIDRLKVGFGNELGSFSFTYLFWYEIFFFFLLEEPRKEGKKLKSNEADETRKFFLKHHYVNKKFLKGPYKKKNTFLFLETECL